MEEISAFSNTYGGYILIGVNNDKTVSGCKKWSEQRIHTTIHDSITPIPNFDVKKFKSKELVIFVIKIEEGAMPPYITNSGKIFERVSSGSFPILNSDKLSQLYHKRQDQLIRTKKKIELAEIRLDMFCPNNLCGYLDLGFSVVCTELTSFQKNFKTFDFTKISKYLKSVFSDFSISRLGQSVLISLGKCSLTKNNEEEVLPNAGIHNFIEIMGDGSVRSRIVFTSDSYKNEVNIGLIVSTYHTFRNIYKIVFGSNYSKIFIYAQKYEKLCVIKQFVPYYNIPSDENKINLFEKYLNDHKKKYGNNLMIESSRLPKNDYSIIDKRFLDRYEIKYNTDNLLKELFHTDFFNLGYIDSLKL